MLNHGYCPCIATLRPPLLLLPLSAGPPLLTAAAANDLRTLTHLSYPAWFFRRLSLLRIPHPSSLSYPTLLLDVRPRVRTTYTTHPHNTHTPASFRILCSRFTLPSFFPDLAIAPPTASGSRRCSPSGAAGDSFLRAPRACTVRVSFAPS